MLSIKEYATLVQKELKDISENYCAETPILDIVTTGSPECMRYALSKRRLARQLGVGCNILNVDEALYGDSYHLEDDYSFESPSIIQLPFFTNPPSPEKDQQLINKCINSNIDVDGLTKDSAFIPATALGIYHYLRNTYTAETNPIIVLVGRGKLVNAPLKKLIEENWPSATVAVIHTRTSETQALELLRIADIIVTATPKAGMTIFDDLFKVLTKKPIIIDAGFVVDLDSNIVWGNVSENMKKKFTAVGCYVSPTIGGVGLLTTTFLLGNVIKYYYDKISTEDNIPFETVYNIMQPQ